MVSLFRRKRGGNEKQEQSQPSQNGSGTASRGPAKDSPRKDKGANGNASTDDANQSNGAAETTTFRVKIPPNVKPGKEFYVYGKNTIIYFKKFCKSRIPDLSVHLLKIF